MPASPLDGMYYQFSIPMGLQNLVQNVISRNQSNPNTPQLPVPTAQREWFSQPRPAFGSPPTITLYTLNEVGHAATAGPTAFASQIAAALTVNPQVFTWMPQSWPEPFIYPPSAAAAAAVANLIATITITPGKFILIGFGLGAEVMSMVLEEVQYGTLQARQFDLLAGVTCGNPLREEGHTIGLPGAMDPGGQGINDHQPGVPAVLTNTPTYWWDFAMPGDVITTTEPSDTVAQQTYTFGRNNFTGQGLTVFLEVAAAVLDVTSEVVLDVVSVGAGLL
jgi:hypothetical protein